MSNLVGLLIGYKIRFSSLFGTINAMNMTYPSKYVFSVYMVTYENHFFLRILIFLIICEYVFK